MAPPLQWLDAALLALGSIGLLVSTLSNSVAKEVARNSAAVMVLGLALAAADPWVYALTAIVIATLITELTFLENVAAILSNRSWWVLRRATPEEVSEKLRQEPAAGIARGSAEPGAASPASASEAIVMGALAYEREVAAALEALGLFDRIRQNMVFSIGGRRNQAAVPMDVVGERGRDAFVFEVRSSSSAQAALSGYARAAANAFNVGTLQNTALGTSAYRNISPVVVVPHDSEFREEKIAGCFVLRFDRARREFTNSSEFSRWIAIVSPLT